MNLIKADHFPTIGSFSSMIDDLFNRSLSDFGATSNFFSHPSVNIKETEQRFELELAAPGLQREDFKVNLDGDVLTVSVEKQYSKEEDNKNYRRKEFSYSAFKRSFQVPSSVDVEHINAGYDKGILTLTLPKKEQAVKATKQIEIN
ncbi:MAG: Hsp20/alpha crystallin family protein [Saprospiraceae bacterium]|nr:Hsp20/alpha crystallin family protein [Saprospiraceae bacterium]